MSPLSGIERVPDFQKSNLDRINTFGPGKIDLMKSVGLRGVQVYKCCFGVKIISNNFKSTDVLCVTRKRNGFGEI